MLFHALLFVNEKIVELCVFTFVISENSPLAELQNSINKDA